MEVSKEDLKNMIIDAFDAGEMWGTTYQGLFNPDPDETEEKIQEIFNRILNNK